MMDCSPCGKAIDRRYNSVLSDSLLTGLLSKVLEYSGMASRASHSNGRVAYAVSLRSPHESTRARLPTLRDAHRYCSPKLERRSAVC
jgi:hypothetical protein